MPISIPRRQFLKNVATAAIAAPAIAQSIPANADPRSVPSPGSPARLRVGLCAYSYREQLTKGTMSLEDLFNQAVELQVDALDMTLYYLKATDPAYLANVRHFASKRALPFSGAACGSSILDGDDTKRASTRRQIKEWIDVTDHLGAPHLRVFTGRLREGETMQQGIAATVETMKVVCDYAAEKGITVGIEDHPGISENAAVCLEILHAVDSPYAGVNIDITHFIATPTMDAYAQIEACLPYATGVTHVRERFDDKSSLVDLDRVFRLFARAAYTGYMSVEYDAAWNQGESAITGVPKLVARTRELCKRFSPS